jgi:hypothetical protein
MVSAKVGLGTGIAMLCVLAGSGETRAEQPLATAITQGKAIIDVRSRYESVDDENCAACKGRSAEAFTIRARLGYETGYWRSLQVLFDFDGIWAPGPEHYNNTRNGKTLYPVIADPDIVTLNRLQITYASNFSTKFVLGRQRVLFGNQRFVGNAGWRQHEQTYDGIFATNTSIKDLTAAYGYVTRVNRVYGPDDPVPTTGQAGYFVSRSHLVNLVYVGVPTLRLEGYAYLLDLSQHNQPVANASKLSTATYGARFEEKYPVSKSVNLLLNGEFAHQTDYAQNPLDISLNYYIGEAGLTYKGLTATGAYEVMQGNGTVGFSTPLATLHLFNGWADVFLTTPTNGVTDAYGKVSYAFKDVWTLKAITPTVVYREFGAEHISQDYGKEWDAQIDVTIDKNASLLAKYANFDGVGPFKDKTVFWLQAAWKL